MNERGRLEVDALAYRYVGFHDGSNTDSSECVLWKTVDAELRGKRDELHLLRQNELNMELRVEAGHNRLVQLMKYLRSNQADLDEVTSHSLTHSLN